MKRIFLLLFLLLSFNILAAVGNLDNIRISNLHTKNASGEINKLAAGSGAWSINFDMEIIGAISDGDTYTISSFGPRVQDYLNPSKSFIMGEYGRPFLSAFSSSFDTITVFDIKIGDEVVGNLKGNLIIFNENITKYKNVKISISFGLGSVYNFNMLSTDPNFGNPVKETFYLRINDSVVGNVIIDATPQKRDQLTPKQNSVFTSEIVLPPVDGKANFYVYSNPYKQIKIGRAHV